MSTQRLLHHHPLPAGTPVIAFDHGRPGSVTPESPASDVMTDLRHTPAFTIEPDASANTALQKMMHAGVRLLLVTNPAGHVVGLITARDLMSEKPVRAATENQIPRDAVTVAQCMVPQQHIEVLDYAEVLRSTVAEIVLTLRHSGRQHALVLESDGPPCVRGIFSAVRIGRQLGVELSASGQMQSFAELEQAIAAL
ncbi:MAG: CBS domain-containing protein, partial [Thiomonas sp.]